MPIRNMAALPFFLGRLYTHDGCASPFPLMRAGDAVASNPLSDMERQSISASWF
jgi:hypothetical protein